MPQSTQSGQFDSSGMPQTIRSAGSTPLTSKFQNLVNDFPASGSEPIGACSAAQSAAEAASEPVGTCAGGYTPLGTTEPLGSCATAQAAAEANSDPAGTAAAVCGAGFEPLGCPAKSAIIRTSQGPRALFAAEYPDVWFFDILEMALEPRKSNPPIDPLFIEACEPGSLKVVSLAVNGAMNAYARIMPDNSISLRYSAWCMPQNGNEIPVATITIAGIPVGTKGMRFLPKTDEDLRKNADMWRQPHMGGRG